MKRNTKQTNITKQQKHTSKHIKMRKTNNITNIKLTRQHKTQTLKQQQRTNQSTTIRTKETA